MISISVCIAHATIALSSRRQQIH